jgi:hypothetical protein
MMTKSKTENCDGAVKQETGTQEAGKREDDEKENEARGYASSPCSLHELDGEFWPVNQAHT